MRAAILIVTPFALLAACGGGGGGTPTGPFQVNLTSAGVSPPSFQALSSATLQFTNQDSVNHQIVSSDCPEISTSTLTPGMNALVTLGPGPKTCTFHDNLNPSAASFQGNVTVLAPGSGY